MKKKVVAIALVTGLALSTTAFANWGRMGGGNWNCPQMGNAPQMGGTPQMGSPGMMAPQGAQPPMMQQIDPETQAKITQFFKDNRDLQKQIVMKRAEKMALLQNENPDAKAVAAVTGELFDLRISLFEKADAAGIAQYIRPGFGPMDCDGPGRGPGKDGKRGMKGGMGRGGQN